MAQQRRKTPNPEHQQELMRLVADGAGEIVFVSAALGWLLGQSASALFGKPVHEIMTVVASLDDKQTKKFDPQKSGFYDVALLRHDRDPVVMPARLDWVKAANGKPYTVIWIDPDNRLKKSKAGDFHQVAHDFACFISENQQKAQAASKRAVPDVEDISTANGELRHFLNLTDNLLGVYRRDMSFMRVNPAFNRVLGFSDAELKLVSFLDLVHADEKDHITQLMQRLIHAPKGEDVETGFECRVRCKDGSYRWMQWANKAASDGLIYIVGSDITDAKQHEAELQRREEQLSEAQKIGRMGHWYLPIDAENIDAQKMEWSDQIYTIFGADKNHFTPTVQAAGSFLPKRDLGRIYKTFQRAILRKRDYEIEFSLRRPGGGGLRYVRCEGRCKLDPRTGKVEALFGIMQDITERTLHEKALQEAKEAAETAYASKTRFLANMSHELRTPLNAIIGFSEMIQRQLLGPVGNARYLEYVGGIRQSGEHLLDLINDILDMSKIEIGKYELYSEELNIGKIIRLALHMVEGRAGEAQVRLIADHLPDDIQIMADRRAVMQILLNILSNAVKFTNPGGSIEITCFRELGGIAITVTDTGIGIPKDKIDLVTMPFEQVESELTRNHDGSGLGLAITKDLIEMHGGTLHIDSDVGVGTVVTVLLPDNIAEKAPMPQRQEKIA